MILIPLLASIGQVTVLAGTGTPGFSGEGGLATAAQLHEPFGLGTGPDGFLYFCDAENDRIRCIAKDSKISTYVGSGAKGWKGDGGPAIAANLNQPVDLTWDQAGNMFFVELGNHTIRKVDGKTKIITTIAGSDKPGFAGDGGFAVSAKLNHPHSLAFDPAGDLFFCDIGNNRVRKIDMQTQNISTWVGNGSRTTSPDGTLRKDASLAGPRAIAFGPDGTLWLALREGNALMKVGTTIQRVVGGGKSTATDADALELKLSGPKGLAVGKDGNIYIADTEAHAIRVYSPSTGRVRLVVGTGKKGSSRKNSEVELDRPHCVALQPDGSLIIADTENHQILRWKQD